MRFSTILIVLAGVLMIAFTFTISATEELTVTNDSTAHISKEEAVNSISWQSVGNAELSILFWDIYKAKLFSSNGEFVGIKGPLKLEITYLIDIKGEDLAVETAKQWQEMGINNNDDDSWLSALHSIFPDLKENDRLAIQLNANGDGLLFHNETLLYEFPPSQQLHNFLAIWLSKDSTRPKLMAKLTGQRK